MASSKSVNRPRPCTIRAHLPNTDQGGDKENPCKIMSYKGLVWSGCRDSNPGPPAPKAGALAGLRYTPMTSCDRPPVAAGTLRCNWISVLINLVPQIACHASGLPVEIRSTSSVQDRTGSVDKNSCPVRVGT